MARKLKPQKVKTLEHGGFLPIQVDIMLDRNTLDFFFDTDGSINGRKRAESIEEIIPLAREYMKMLAVIEWEPVIEVWHETRYGQASYYGEAKREDAKPDRCDVELSFERYERGKYNGEWKVKRKHLLDVDPDDGFEMNQREQNKGTWYGGHGTVIPYSDAAWATLHAIVQGVHDLNAKLEALLGDENTAKHLLERMGAKLPPMLPAFAGEDAPTYAHEPMKGALRRARAHAAVVKNGGKR